VRYVVANKIEGDFVECGVGNGHMERVWIQELQYLKELQYVEEYPHIYLYDTFLGLTKPSEYDRTCENSQHYQMSTEEVQKTWEQNIIMNGVNGWSFANLEFVKHRVLSIPDYPHEKIHFIQGDVKDTLSLSQSESTENFPSKIAILRLDTDWYESTKIELEALYDRVVPGGLIIFDDYYHWEGQRRAVDNFFQERNLSLDSLVDLRNGKTAAIIKCG
jgi:hypothetical protein